ncbi:MAG: glycosyltransferase family 4 protein [Anaerolineae bacterium]
MRIVYLLLSPTFGMHQYTADLANRMAEAGHDVHLVTSIHAPQTAYSPQVAVHTPVTSRSTGFSRQGLRLNELHRAQALVERLRPTLIHITGVHVWNPLLLRRWHERIPVVHTLHDLDPHVGVRFAPLIRAWNHMVIARADHLLVHGEVYRKRLLALGVPATRVTMTPLLHSFVSHNQLNGVDIIEPQFEPWALFFGRLERYKGVAQVIAAAAALPASVEQSTHLVLAGQGDLPALLNGPLPASVAVRNYLITDQEAIDLFQRCSLLVLPYIDATQSALIASAYYFGKPVIVTAVGALPEYVQPGRTGWVVPPDDVPALAQQLADALSDPHKLRRMGQAGQAWYREQRGLEWKTITAMYHQVSQHSEAM